MKENRKHFEGESTGFTLSTLMGAAEYGAGHVRPNQEYLKFPKHVILNLSQDLTQWINRHAEPILKRVQHKVYHDSSGVQDVGDKFSELNM